MERQLSFTISVPSRLSAQLENDGKLNWINFDVYNWFELIIFLLFFIKETQIVDDEEMKTLKDEYLNDIDFIPAHQN